MASSYEVEAKYGTIVDRNTNTRLSLPVLNAVVLNQDFHQNIRFNSDISMNCHAQVNKLLNGRVKEEPTRWKYKHIRVVDRFIENLPDGSKLRATVDESDMSLQCVISKKRIADFHIHVPRSPFDIRITINVERPREVVGIEEQESFCNRPAMVERRKDRMSYHLDGGFLAVDLTQVKDNGRILHELEVEAGSAETLCRDSNLTIIFLRNILDLLP